MDFLTISKKFSLNGQPDELLNITNIYNFYRQDLKQFKKDSDCEEIINILFWDLKIWENHFQLINFLEKKEFF